MNYEDRDQYGIYKSRAKGITTSAGENSPAPAFMGAETLIGSDVYNHKSENIGSIKEIMLNLHDGKVAYAVLSFGGFLGMGKVIRSALGKLNTRRKEQVFCAECRKGIS